MWGKLIASEQYKMVQFLPGSLLKHFADFKHFPFHSKLKIGKATTVLLKISF